MKLEIREQFWFMVLYANDSSCSKNVSQWNPPWRILICCGILYPKDWQFMDSLHTLVQGWFGTFELQNLQMGHVRFEPENLTCCEEREPMQQPGWRTGSSGRSSGSNQFVWVFAFDTNLWFQVFEIFKSKYHCFWLIIKLRILVLMKKLQFSCWFFHYFFLFFFSCWRMVVIYQNCELVLWCFESSGNEIAQLPW